MSKVAIQGNASGSGIFTLAAPNSNTDRTLTLPDEAGTVLTSGTAASSVPGYGNQITEMDVWCLDTNITVSTNNANTDLTSNVSRYSTAWFSKVGTGMSQSSGIFTFPSTGMWQIYFQTYTRDADDDNEYVEPQIRVTTDNGSNWYAASYNINSIPYMSGNTAYAGAGSISVIRVTDTANTKVLFRVASSNSLLIQGSGVTLATYMIFIRLGDAS